MKLPGLLLLLGLLASAAGPAPVVRITFSALTDAAYMATPRRKVAAKPRVTFPLSKQHGRIAIPTAKGPRIFRDVVVDAQSEYSESQAITYKYLGYFPAQHCHLVHVSYYEIEKWVLLSDAGERVDLWGQPIFAPDGHYLAATCEGLEYGGGQPNLVQLVALRDGLLREVWRLRPKNWEPSDSYWISATSLIVEKQTWNEKSKDETYSYAKLTIQP